MMFKFPCFRDKKWIQEKGTNMQYPHEFLNVHFRPDFLKNYEHTKDFEKKIEHVINQIKTALFRQAIYKIQNVEVVAMHECKDDRVLEKIQQINGYKNIKLGDKKVLCDEIWTVKRCDKKFSYWIRYYEEDKNGYSLSVLPTQLKNIYYFLKYYYF
ncbi:hypothetical protein PGSY75_1121200 [Plasmodium gaboni]|uniref:Uncharacterized protein n=1 Tax=Plasmodium gaboni TaxID=647221 RepID=A0A151LIS0_9APIC|nr:hypothetical protein PGSY75_1121200 [Plasmodium gaboni]XP_028538912.1 conserved Plasmodium protein, unknown function [Plasmodium sp. gorilla clade G2]SOV23289.1 conserved Plasmodium protein, unknown function [Plasmodium sp. DRC-Itaito]KYN98853.1 hypothetical protein PGSY75_1121200 [Plasmodium gaboni]SOV15620.1 conserved Plasmodium protein, unknown function [Plasmodium gaboni]SOV15631.1 conserved Plasmodium protein, unknown function [Plasmodium sp. gorilla clade G2]